MSEQTGDWQCLECGYVLHRRFLYAQTGQVAINTSAESELCPNDSSVLVPLTEELHCERYHHA